MRNILTILFICLLPFFTSAQIADAGANHTIYLTGGSNSTTVGGTSSGDSYHWTKIYDVQPVQAGYPIDPSTIVNPDSAQTGITGMVQGVWYYQLAVTSGGITALDTVVIKVDYDYPPANSTLIKSFNWDTLASTANDRHDTTGYLGYSVGNYYGSGTTIYFERSRLNGSMVDSSRGKFYSTIEDGYGWNGYSYARSELNWGSFAGIDSNKTYVFEWKGYYPQSITANIPLREPLTPTNYSRVVSPMQIHGNDATSPPFSFQIRHDSLTFVEYGGSGNGANRVVKVMSTDDSYILNKAHTIRLTLREGKGYSGQDAFVKVEVDGVQKYYRDTGQVGQTFQNDYVKFASLYDFNQAVVDVDSLSRGRKFSLVTEMMNVWEIQNAPVVDAGDNQTIIIHGNLKLINE